MKIAVSTDAGSVSAHFGRCPSFTIADIEGGKVIKKEDIPNPGHEPGFLPAFLREKGVKCIIAGGMGPRAVGLFSEAGIQTVVGITGAVDAVLDMAANGTLKGGESLCSPGAGKGYGVDKTVCEHGESQPDEKQGTLEKGEKVCITAQGNNLDAEVDPRFGRCRYFIFVDTGTMEFEAVENPNADSSGGAGIQSGQLIADRGVKTVLTGNVGPNAFKTLDTGGVSIITGVSGTVKEAVAKFVKGGMKTADSQTVDEHFGK